MFKRRLGYYLFHTYVPTCLIVIMSWISFWIKPEAVPARVTLGVTSLLTLSTQHANSQKSLPPVSYIKVFPFFMNGTFGLLTSFFGLNSLLFLYWHEIDNKNNNHKVQMNFLLQLPKVVLYNFSNGSLKIH